MPGISKTDSSRQFSVRRDRIIRMQAEANARLRDADKLAAAFPVAESDSGEIISVLAFEVLLKCAIYTSTDKFRKGHDYWRLWNTKLSEEVRTSVERMAKERMPGNTNFGDMKRLLDNYERVFTKARYYYEFYDDQTLEEQEAEGVAWHAQGAPTEKAVVQYCPLELRCLCEALNHYITDNIPPAPA